jgi:hypothetical protein
MTLISKQKINDGECVNKYENLIFEKGHIRYKLYEYAEMQKLYRQSHRINL